MLLTLSLFLQSKCIHCKKNLTCHLYQKMGYRRRGFSFFLSPSEANPLCEANPFFPLWGRAQQQRGCFAQGGKKGEEASQRRTTSPCAKQPLLPPLVDGKKLAKGERGGKKLGDNASRCSIYLINSNLCLS